MDYVELSIEKTVDLDLHYPRVHKRYYTDYYFVPLDNNIVELNMDDGSAHEDGNENAANVEDPAKQEDESVVEEEGESPIEERKKNGPSFHLGDLDHTCVMIHTNKLCLLTLSHYHPVLAQKKEITKINFDVGKFNRLDNQVSGKGKRGAQMFGLRSPVCIISCADGSEYTVLAGVNGKLIEVNERLLSNPQLLSMTPREEGYLAIVLPPLRNGKSLMNKLLSKEQYEIKVNEHLSGVGLIK